MQVLGTLVWMGLLGNSLLPLVTGHVCDGLPSGTHVCDPASKGTKYFVCMTKDTHVLQHCPHGLVFSNDITACVWPHNAPECVATTTTTTTTTTTPTTTSPTTLTTSTTPHPTAPPQTTTTTTGVTTDPTKETSTTPTSAETPTHGPPTGPVCQNVPSGSWRCDPATNGTSFILCLLGEAFYYQCPAGTFFNQDTAACDWQENIEVMCVAGGSSSQQTPSGTAPTTTTTSGTTSTTTMAPFPSGPCNAQNCQLPDCCCMGTDIPGHLNRTDVPQMVLVTFDDHIGWGNFKYYDQLYPSVGPKVLRNPNNCSVAATFFVSKKGTDMDRVRKLAGMGHEMASHSLTHGHPTAWSWEQWEKEMQGMRGTLATELGVPVTQIAGMRTPYLELGGEVQFSMMQHHGITYDSSMFGGSLNNNTATLPVWPFTLRNPPSPGGQMCDQANCPQRSYPGVWEVPLIRQYALNGQPCSMTDACHLPYDATPDDVTRFLRQNFLRHYQGNRAPFMVSLHATWFQRVPGSLQGLRAFLEEVNVYADVWQVTLTQMLDWVRHPVPQDRLQEQPLWAPCV